MRTVPITCSLLIAFLLGAGCTSGLSPDAQTPAPGKADGTATGGCGKAPPSVGRTTASIDVDGVTHNYILAVPPSYDPNTPQPLIWQFHGITGDGASIETGMPIRDFSNEQGIFVYPDGNWQDQFGGGTGWNVWDADDNNDVAMVDQLTQQLEDDYCIDTSRVFAAGFSFGGMFTNTLGCYRGNVFRAIAPMAGRMYFDPTRCTEEVPSIFAATGQSDTAVTQDEGFEAFSFTMERLACSEDHANMDGLPCAESTSCPTGNRAVWCADFPDDHVQPYTSWPEAETIWGFFDSFQ